MPSAKRKTLADISAEVAERKVVAYRLAELDWMLGQKQAAFEKLGASTWARRKQAAVRLRRSCRRFFPPRVVNAQQTSAALRRRLAGCAGSPASAALVEQIRESFDLLARIDRRGFESTVGEVRAYARYKRLRRKAR